MQLLLLASTHVAEWSGKATTHGQDLAFFRFVGWMTLVNSKGAVKWLDNFEKLNRWLLYLDDPTLTPKDTQVLQIPA